MDTFDQKVFIVDDDEAVRDSMSMLLESAGLHNQCYSSATEFLNSYDNSQHGCLILDIRMPGLSGLELQEQLKQRKALLPIIFITGHGDVPMAVEAMRQGALDFMRKPINEDDLLQRTRCALSYEAGLRDKIQDRENVLDKIALLTAREKQVFDRVATGKANKEIAFDLGISERTVEVHRSQVMKKLEVRALAELVRIKIETEIPIR